MLGLRELPGVHRAGTEVTGLAGTDDVAEGFHRLLDRRLGVPAVHLVEVDVIHAESRERCVDRGEDVLAGEATAVRPRCGRIEDLGRDDDFVAAEELPQQPARDGFALAR